MLADVNHDSSPKPTSIRSSAAPGLAEGTSITNGDSVQRRPRLEQTKSRKTSGPEVQVNGDVMEIDSMALPNGDRNATPPPTESSTQELLPTPPPTLTNGSSQGIQVGQKPEPPLETETTYLRFDDPDSEVYHTAWNPSDPVQLYTAGQTLSHLWQVPSTHGSSIEGVDVENEKDHYLVTATCWGDRGELFVATADECPDLVKPSLELIYTRSGFIHPLPSFQDTILTLRYHSKRRSLLGLAERSFEVWDITAKDRAPSKIKVSEMLLDAVWTGKDEIVLSGENHVFLYGFIDGGVVLLRTLETMSSGPHSFDILRHNPGTNFLAFASTTNRSLMVVDAQGNIRINLEPRPQHQITACDFQSSDEVVPKSSWLHSAT